MRLESNQARMSLCGSTVDMSLPLVKSTGYAANLGICEHTLTCSKQKLGFVCILRVETMQQSG